MRACITTSLFVLSLSSVAAAQDNPRIDPHGEEEELPPLPEPPDDEPQPDRADAAPPTTRWVAEIGAGLAVMGVAAAGGYLLSGEPAGGIFSASLIGFVGGFPMAAIVATVGEALGANGGAGWAVLGTVIGGLLSAPIAFAAMASTFEDSDEDGVGADHTGAAAGAITAITVLPTLGAVIAYEASSDSDDETRRTPRRRRRAVRSAGLSATPDGQGVMATASGTF